MEIVYRYFPCDGQCGRYIEVPTAIARSLMKPNGIILPHEEVLCPLCLLWVELEIELMLKFPVEVSSQMLLPRIGSGS